MEAILVVLEPLVLAYSGKLGFLVQAVSIVGTLRMFIKPLMSLALTYVAATPSPKDDEKLKEVMESKWYKGVVYFLDWFASLKLPKQDKK